MKDSYRGNMRTSAPSMIHTSGFVGPNKGPLYNAIATIHGGYKAYESLPGWLRYTLFGDEGGFVDDQNSPNSRLNEYGELRHPKSREEDAKRQAEKEAKDKADAERVALEAEENERLNTDYGNNYDSNDEMGYDYHDDNGNEYAYEGYEDGDDDSARGAYEAGKAEQALMDEAEEHRANGYDENDEDGEPSYWSTATEITTATPEEGVKSMEFEDSSAKEWQKFLVDNKYLAPTYKGKDGKQHNSVDGDWGPESQKAYEAYMKDHPEEE